MNKNKVRILLVEDNLADSDLIQYAFEESSFVDHIHVAQDGEIALEYLRKEGLFREANTPDLILLDLNLPKIDGREVLKTIKQDINLRAIPVVVLSSSELDEDMIDCYENHASSYIVKPHNIDQLVKTVASIEAFYFLMASLPANN